MRCAGDELRMVKGVKERDSRIFYLTAFQCVAAGLPADAESRTAVCHEQPDSAVTAVLEGVVQLLFAPHAQTLAKERKRPGKTLGRHFNPIG